MAQSKLLNRYCRTIGVLLIFVMPLIILIFLVLGNFKYDNPNTILAGILWFFLFLNSLAFTLNGFMIVRDFKEETAKKAEEGFPIDSLEGFSVMSGFTRGILTSSSLISGVILISLVLFLSSLIIIPLFNVLPSNLLPPGLSIEALQTFISTFIYLSAIGLAFIAIGIVLLLKIPEKPAFEPGAMMKYYYPRSTPLSLDNLLSDSLLAFLDPITRMRFDEWTDSLKNSLRSDYEPELDETTRLEQAREKTLLLFYLKKRMPVLLPENVFDEELTEVIDQNKLAAFKEGKDSGIGFKVLEDVFDQLLENIPEIFITIDRLIIELVDNLAEFRDNEDIWVSVAAPETVKGNLNPFRILIFALNKNTKDFADKKRLVTFRASGSTNTFMEHLEYSLALDEAEEVDVGDKLPFVSDSEDILGLLSKLLQIGDAVWFTFERPEFKEHLFSVSITESDRGAIFGQTIRVEVVRDLNYFLTTYGGRLSAVTGLIIPLFSFVLGV